MWRMTSSWPCACSRTNRSGAWQLSRLARQPLRQLPQQLVAVPFGLSGSAFAIWSIHESDSVLPPLLDVDASFQQPVAFAFVRLLRPSLAPFPSFGVPVLPHVHEHAVRYAVVPPAATASQMPLEIVSAIAAETMVVAVVVSAAAAVADVAAAADVVVAAAAATAADAGV